MFIKWLHGHVESDFKAFFFHCLAITVESVPIVSNRCVVFNTRTLVCLGLNYQENVGKWTKIVNALFQYVLPTYAWSVVVIRWMPGCAIKPIWVLVHLLLRTTGIWYIVICFILKNVFASNQMNRECKLDSLNLQSSYWHPFSTWSRDFWPAEGHFPCVIYRYSTWLYSTENKVSYVITDNYV